MESIYLVLDSDRSEVHKIEKLLNEVSEKIGLENERMINFQIAVSEAVVNAIVHGNKENPSKKVHIIVNSGGDSVEIKVRDEGGGFDIGKLPDPTNDENIMKESGRGIYIIRSLVDEFGFDSTDEGTELAMKVYKKK